MRAQPFVLVVLLAAACASVPPEPERTLAPAEGRGLELPWWEAPRRGLPDEPAPAGAAPESKEPFIELPADPLFAPGSAVLDDTGRGLVCEAAAGLADSELIVVAGATDPVGTVEDNFGLSHRRAEAGRAALLGCDDPPANVTTEAWGEECQIGGLEHLDETDRNALNRRLVIWATDSPNPPNTCRS